VFDRVLAQARFLRATSCTGLHLDVNYYTTYKSHVFLAAMFRYAFCMFEVMRGLKKITPLQQYKSMRKNWACAKTLLNTLTHGNNCPWLSTDGIVFIVFTVRGPL
jgi:hypothetical protein